MQTQCSHARPGALDSAAWNAEASTGVSAVELPADFDCKDLFNLRTIEACEAASDDVEISAQGDDVSSDGGVDGPPPLKRMRMGSKPLSPTERKAKKQRKRAQKASEKWRKDGHLPTSSAKVKYVGASQQLPTNVRVEALPVKAGGYTAISKDAGCGRELMSLEEARSAGFTVVEFNGFNRPIVDHRTGRVLAALIPAPSDPSYKASVDRAFLKMMDEGDRANFSTGSLKHKRGDGFAAINVGLTYGNGHTKPSRPKLGRHKHLVEALLADEDIQRLAAYQDAAYALWHPKAYRYYKEELDKLWEACPELVKPLFYKSIMPTVAFNIGRQVATKKHIDSQNCPFGWCIVTALGNFDYKVGGHIILWELKVVLEFPAGSCVCLPSAIIAHSNLPTMEGDTRASFTQYCSGEVFRYIENGFSTDVALKTKDPLLYAINGERRKTRLMKGYEMFSTIQELLGSRQ